MNTIERVTKRHILRKAQPTVIWEPHHFLELPEAESVGVLPYTRWLDLLTKFLTDPDLSEAERDQVLEQFQIEEHSSEAKSLSQPLR